MTKIEYKRLDGLTDEDIVDSLLEHNSTVTNWFFYKKCYPLFKAAFLKFAPSFQQHGVMIEDVLELTNDIYLHILSPRENKENGLVKKCALESFGFSCSLYTWLKVVTKHYCLYLIKKNRFVHEPLEQTNSDGDNYMPNEPSIDIDSIEMTLADVTKVINMVSIPRNRRILYLHYIELLSSEEAAAELGITKAAYDNALSRAKKEFNELIMIHLR